MVESLFLEPLVSRTSRYLEPNLVSLGFASLKLYNFTPDFSNLRFLETPDNSNQFWLPWDKLTLDNSNLQKFRNHLVRMSITFTPLNKLTLPDKLLSRIFITQQASHKSVISLKGTKIKIWTLTHNQTIPGQLSVISISWTPDFSNQFAFHLEVREIGIPL